MRTWLVPLALGLTSVAQGDPAPAQGDPGPAQGDPAPAQGDPPVRVPPGTRIDAQGQRISGRGLRETGDFLAAELARRGIDAQRIGPYATHGVALIRLLSRTATTPWSAIHVLRAEGKTLIFFVPRAKSAATP